MTKQSEVYPCKFCIEHGLNESNGCGCWDMTTHTDTDELEHKIARIVSSMQQPDGYKVTNGERNDEAHRVKQDPRFAQIMKLITAYTTNREREAWKNGYDRGFKAGKELTSE